MKYMQGISVVIPIYNESQLLKNEITRLLKKLRGKYRYEIILIENGSLDDTYSIAKELSKEHAEIKVLRMGKPCYGAALKLGIAKAKFPLIVQFDLDLVDLDFLKKSVALLETYDIVVGSKMLPASRDRRHFLRLCTSKITNLLLKKILHYKGTDTHGIKAYRTRNIREITKRLKPTHHFFDTEVLLTAQSRNMNMTELPISVSNLRPTRFNTKIIIKQAVFEFLALVSKRNSFSGGKGSFDLFTADDAGISAAANEAIFKHVRNKRIGTVSILPNMPLPKTASGAKTAIHLNLIEGKPVSSPDAVPTLVDRSGYFYPFPILYARLCFNLVNFKEITREIENQITVIRSAVRKNSIVELNSHQHTHTLYPIDRIVAAQAEKYRIPNIRRYGAIVHFSLRGFLVHYSLLALAFFEHLLYGKYLSQSPIWQKGERPISFMSWEDDFRKTAEPKEIVCHPGTLYDKTDKHLLLSEGAFE